jgi:MtrB/PioB family decaheme-associated outer membrane protein
MQVLAAPPRLRRALLSIAAMFAAATCAADDSGVDTSQWKCTQCPFLQGYDTQTETGVLYANGANATFGRYTGIDHSGVYADVAASGQARSDDGSYFNYDLERLGLASRDGYVEGGSEGRYDLRLSYDGQPHRFYDTGATPYQMSGTNLTLPSGWVTAGSTGGMSALNGALRPIDIESDRRTVALLARYFASDKWTLFGEFRRQEHDGVGLGSASFLTEAVQFPQPFDYVTNSFETGAAWAGSKASLRLSYTGSWFEDNSDSILFANPYSPIVPGSIQGQLSLPPSNMLQQLNTSGNLQLPWASTLTGSASLSTLKQNAGFLPVSTLPGVAPMAASSLDGDVHLTHFALGLASHPISKLSIRGNAGYDGRDDKTNPLTIAYVVTDTFPGGTAVTPRYSEDHVRLDGGADYALARWIRVGIGGKLDDVHYGPGQVVTWTQNAQSWARAMITPIAPLSFSLKYGNALRKTSSYDAAALPPEESPLIREFNYAPRDRVFSTFSGTWSVSATLTWSLEESLAKDDYRSSPLGLQSTHEQRASSTLTWSPRESLSAHLDAGYERLFNLQSGSTGANTPPWLSADADRFWNLGVGGRWIPQARWTLTLDYLMAPSYDNTETLVGGTQQFFPQNSSKLESTRFAISYNWTSATQIRFRYTREHYDSSDWSLNGVGPATLPNLLAMGVQPYRDTTNMFGLTVRYEFGADHSRAHASP